MVSGTRKRLMIGIAAAIVALLALAGTALAAGPNFRGFAAGNGNSNGNASGTNQANARGFGPRAVVTATDPAAQTITLGGLPQQIATVKVDQNVKLVAIQPDGTTQDAAFGDFKAGSLVEVHFKFNGRGPGRGHGQPGNGQGQPGNGQPPANNNNNNQGAPMVTVTELALVPVGQVRTEGLVTSTTGGVQIVTSGGLQLTVNTAGAKVTKGQNTAASAGDIVVGSRIMVSGTQSGTTINATTIRIIDLSAFGHRGMMPGNAPKPPSA